jgi:hypothetical protein
MIRYIGFPRGVTTEELATAEWELKTFTETTLEHLIKAERLAYHYTPSISLFCRLDIGVMPDNKGHLPMGLILFIPACYSS